METNDLAASAEAGAGAAPGESLPSAAEAAQPSQPAAGATLPDAAESALEPSPAAPTSVSLTLDKLVSRVEEWVRSHLRDSPVSRSTEAWNHLTGSLPALHSIIMKE